MSTFPAANGTLILVAGDGIGSCYVYMCHLNVLCLRQAPWSYGPCRPYAWSTRFGFAATSKATRGIRPVKYRILSISGWALEALGSGTIFLENVHAFSADSADDQHLCSHLSHPGRICEGLFAGSCGNAGGVLMCSCFCKRSAERYIDEFTDKLQYIIVGIEFLQVGIL